MIRISYDWIWVSIFAAIIIAAAYAFYRDVIKSSTGNEGVLK